MTDVRELYQPFGEDELNDMDKTLDKEDTPIQTFQNKGIYLISVILVTLAVMIALTVFLGFFYELGYKKDKISSRNDLIASGMTVVQADLQREQEGNKLKNDLKNDLMIAGYALGGIAITVTIWYFATIWYWRGVAQPELTRENIIGRDISYSMKTGNSIDNVSNLLAYHVHPNDSTKRKKLGASFGQNLRGSLRNELNFSSAVAGRLTGRRRLEDLPPPPPDL